MRVQARVRTRPRETHIHTPTMPSHQADMEQTYNDPADLQREALSAERTKAILFGWTTDDKTIEKGSTALLFSMLLKIIVIEWTAVWRLGIQFEPDKVWRIFWSRAKRQWEETKADKEAEFRNIRQRESCTKSTRIGIARQIAPMRKARNRNHRRDRDHNLPTQLEAITV